MAIVFTICSNNYLAQAKTLGDSLRESNPDYKFIIGLVDEFSETLDYSFFEPYTIIPVAQIGLSDLENYWKKYNIIELNTCVKPSYFKYIFNTYEKENQVFYLDPDTFVYEPLRILEEAFVNNDLLITPHILSPVESDGDLPSENLFLNYGIYNLGFIGVHRKCYYKNGFLDWWDDRTLKNGFADTANGVFVDQLYINFIPLFYEKVKILKNPGFNVAPWNLHERRVVSDESGKSATVNNEPLYFYHFSSYKFDTPERMSKFYRYTFQTNPELIQLYKAYCEAIIENKVEEFSIVPCIYEQKRQQYELSKIIVPSKKEIAYGKFKSAIKFFVPPLFLSLIRKSSSLA